MTSYQESKLGMYDTVLYFFRDFLAALPPVPALKPGVARLTEQTADIKDGARMQALGSRGITHLKQAATTQLIEEAVMGANVVFAWAASTGNLELKHAVQTCPWALSRLRDTELLATCRNFYNAAQQYFTHLEFYGLTTERLAAFEAALKTFEQSMTLPRNAIAALSGTARRMKKLFKDTDLLLREQIDPLMRNLQRQYPQEAAVYFLSRKVVHRGKRVTQLKLQVVDTRARPLAGVIVAVAEAGIETVSNRAGLAHIKPLRPGVYTLRISAPDYEPVELADFKVVMGKVNRVEVVMKASDDK